MKYFHDENNKENNTSAVTLEERVLELGDKKLLVVQRQNNDGLYFVVVPGYVVEYKKKDHTFLGELTYSEIQPIAKDEKEQIKKVVEDNGFKGPISFW
jgi:preprotein translocase subunit SecB